MARDTRFRLRHGLIWLLYLWLLRLNLEMLFEARSSSGLTLLPAVLLSWMAVFIAAANIQAWLDGASRWVLFRLALALTAVVSCLLAAWMVWHYAVFLFVGLITMFQRPFELISLTLFAERLMTVLLSLATFATFAWLSLRVIWALRSGEREVDLGHVLDGSRTVNRSSQPMPGPESIKPPGRGSLAGKIWRFVEPVRPPRPPVEVQPPGKQRYLQRPPELTPAFDATYEVHGPPILQGLGFRHGVATHKREKAAAIGWAAFEWVFRSEPSCEEIVMALEALPNLASTIDDDDAIEARDWISRLADHPGEYESALHRMEIVDAVTSETIRIADVAFQTLLDWDLERSKRPAAAPDHGDLVRTGPLEAK